MPTPQGTILPRGHPDRFKPTRPTSTQSSKVQDRKRKFAEEQALSQNKRSAGASVHSQVATPVSPARARPTPISQPTRSFADKVIEIPARKSKDKASSRLDQPPYLVTVKDMSEADVRAYYATAKFDFGWKLYRIPEWLNKIGPMRARLVTNIVVRGRPIFSDCEWPEKENGIETNAAQHVLKDVKRYIKGKAASWLQPGVVKARVYRRIAPGSGSGTGQVLTSDPDATYREWQRADKEASEQIKTSASDGMKTDS